MRAFIMGQKFWSLVGGLVRIQWPDLDHIVLVLIRRCYSHSQVFALFSCPLTLLISTQSKRQYRRSRPGFAATMTCSPLATAFMDNNTGRRRRVLFPCRVLLK